MKRCILFSPLLAPMCFVTLPARAAGLIIIEDSQFWPGPEPIPPGPFPPRPIPPRPIHRPRPHIFAPMEVSYVKANTPINDQIAVTAIDQEFYNPNSTRLEGNFVF